MTVVSRLLLAFAFAVAAAALVIAAGVALGWDGPSIADQERECRDHGGQVIVMSDGTRGCIEARR